MQNYRLHFKSTKPDDAGVTGLLTCILGLSAVRSGTPHCKPSSHKINLVEKERKAGGVHESEAGQTVNRRHMLVNHRIQKATVMETN